MAKQLFIMIGAPGSGKSTWVKRQIREDIDRYVSRDEIRFSLLKEGDAYFKYEDEVFATFVERIADYINDDNDIYRIFADASHLNYGSRMKLLNALKEKGVNLNLININYIYMFTSLETCLQRNALREGRARVPEKTIEEMYKNLREPEPDEPVKNVYIVNEHRQCIDIKFMNAKDTNNFEF